MFARGFIRSLLIILVMITIAIVSYRIVMHMWDIPVPVTDELISTRQQEEEPITQAVIDDISKNLIFNYDDQTGDIRSILLEIFHLEEKRMQYITIPIRTQFTMSEALYRKLVLVHPTIPQVIKLSNIRKYFDEDTVYDYGTLILEDLLGVDISFYTALPNSIYETMFTTKELINTNSSTTTLETVENNDNGASCEVFSEEYIAFLKTIKTEQGLRDYIEEIYPYFKSNLSLAGKMNYLESYCRTSLSKVTFDRIEGINQNSAYIIDQALAKQQVESYIAGYVSTNE